MVQIAIIASLDRSIFSEIITFFATLNVPVNIYHPDFLDPLEHNFEGQTVFNLIADYPTGITLKPINTLKQLLLQVLPQLFEQAIKSDNLKLLFKIWAGSRVYIKDQVMQNALLLSYKLNMYHKTYPIANTAIFEWISEQLNSDNNLILLNLLTINQPYGKLKSLIKSQSLKPNRLSTPSIFKLIHGAILSLAEQNASYLWSLLSVPEQLEFINSVGKNYLLLEKEPYPSTPLQWIAALPGQIDLRIKMLGEAVLSSKDIEFIIQESLNWKDDLNMIYRKSEEIKMLEAQLDYLIYTAFECAAPAENEHTNNNFDSWLKLSLNKKCEFIEQDFTDLEWKLFQKNIHKWISQELQKITTDILDQNDIEVGFQKSNEFLILLDNSKFNRPEILNLKFELSVFIEDLYQMMTPATQPEIKEVVAVKPLKECRSDLMKAIKLGDAPLINSLLDADNVVSSKVLLSLIDLGRSELIQRAYLKKTRLFTPDIIAIINTHNPTCIRTIPEHPSFTTCITKAKPARLKSVLKAIKKNPAYSSQDKSLTFIEKVILERINSSELQAHQHILETILPDEPIPARDNNYSEIAAECFIAEPPAQDKFALALNRGSRETCIQIWNELTRGEQINLVITTSSQPFFENFFYNWVVCSARLTFENGRESDILTNVRFLYLLVSLFNGRSLQMDDLKEALSNALSHPESEFNLRTFPRPQEDLVFDRCTGLVFFGDSENKINDKTVVDSPSDYKYKA